MSLSRCRRTLVLASGFALVIACVFAREARANMAKWWHDGEGHGPLVPAADSDIRVDSEDLAFEVAPTLDRAAVTATYRLTNGGATRSATDVAFVVVESENATGKDAKPAHAAIEIDGAAVPFRVVTETDALAASRIDDDGGTGDGEPRRVSATEGPTERRRRLVTSDDAGAGDVEKLRASWAPVTKGRRLSWLGFRLDLEAGATRTVTVRYEHLSGADAHRGVNLTYTYDYLLSPAKRWARFGPLHLTIKTPPGTQLTSSLPVVETNGSHRADFPSLPEGELSFGVMSRAGLLFGMTQPTGYWLLLAFAIAVVLFPASARLGRVWARASAGAVVVAGCVLGTGLVASVVMAAIMVAGSLVAPAGALGAGYGTFFGVVALWFLFTTTAAAISGVVAAKTRRAARLAAT